MEEGKLILILGGARSGKSDYAQKLAQSSSERVLYVATAEAGDDEMEERIQKHRASRPAHWMTLEAPRNVGRAVEALASKQDVIVLDCLTLLASNCITRLPEPFEEEEAQRVLDQELDGIIETCRKSNTVWIVVSNEVGLGLVPPYAMGRIYRDVLGRLNQRLAARADEVIFMAAGLPLFMKRGDHR